MRRALIFLPRLSAEREAAAQPSFPLRTRGRMSPHELDTARPDEREQAFRLLLSHCAPDHLPRRLDSALRMIQADEMDPAGLRVLRRGGIAVGAGAAVLVPGGSGLVWPPHASDGPLQRIDEDRLAVHLLDWLRQRGAALAQALLPPDEVFLAEPLLRNGFAHVTSLWYLRHDGEMPADSLAFAARLHCGTYAETDPDLFRETLVRTFEGSLDCPEVMDSRPVDEILKGFQGQGVFDPRVWWLASDEEGPAGVLILCAMPDEPTWEVCYVGVTPERRRRGYGRELMLKAMFEARAAGIGEVFLTVDGRNKPAWDLYRSLGFEVFDQREVFLAFLNGR